MVGDGLYNALVTAMLYVPWQQVRRCARDCVRRRSSKLLLLCHDCHVFQVSRILICSNQWNYHMCERTTQRDTHKHTHAKVLSYIFSGKFICYACNNHGWKVIKGFSLKISHKHYAPLDLISISFKLLLSQFGVDSIFGANEASEQKKVNAFFFRRHYSVAKQQNVFLSMLSVVLAHIHTFLVSVLHGNPIHHGCNIPGFMEKEHSRHGAIYKLMIAKCKGHYANMKPINCNPHYLCSARVVRKFSIHASSKYFASRN